MQISVHCKMSKSVLFLNLSCRFFLSVFLIGFSCRVILSKFPYAHGQHHIVGACFLFYNRDWSS